MKNLLPTSSYKHGTLALASATFIVLAALLLAVSLVHAQNSDYAINVNNNSLCTNPGIDTRYVISVSSLGGFSGTVNLGSSIDPNVASSPSLSTIPSSVTLSSGETTSFDLIATTTQSTPTAVFTITVSGLSGSTFHSVSMTLTVASDCSVGATVVSTATHASMSIFLTYGLGIALVGSAIATTAVFANRKKSSL